MQEEKMSDEITPDLFSHLVELAAMELNPDEAEYLRKEMNNQLKAIHELVAIPIDSELPIASHGIPYSASISANIRPDEWNAYLDPGKLLAQAPEIDDGYIVVPEIPHKDLD
jgi:aspartyl-tRNA(Asn)/glutamyl-tRNA(Gln) amidotransferase subunit C